MHAGGESVVRCDGALVARGDEREYLEKALRCCYWAYGDIRTYGDIPDDRLVMDAARSELAEAGR